MAPTTIQTRLDGFLQKVMLVFFKERILHARHYAPIAEHPGNQRIYDTMEMELFWHMASEVYDTVSNCATSARSGQWLKEKNLFGTVPASGPLKFVAIDIFGALTQRKNGSVFVIVVTDRYLKMKRAIPTSNRTAAYILKVSLDQWILSYGTSDYMLTDNGPQFVSMFFSRLCGVLGLNHLTKTAYHSQMNGQVEKYNKTIISR